MNYREKIRKAIECPSFGDTAYGEWGALTLEQRKYIKRLLDELDSADNYFKNVYLENKKLKENYERIYNENCILREKHNINDIDLLDKNQELKKQLHEASLTIQEMIEQDIECPSDCEKLRQLKKQVEENTETLLGRILELRGQQKEFIKYLEEEIRIYSKTTYAEEILKELEEILKEYKKIIGVLDENNKQ